MKKPRLEPKKEQLVAESSGDTGLIPAGDLHRAPFTYTSAVALTCHLEIMHAIVGGINFASKIKGMG